jgi:hypothetical protein
MNVETIANAVTPLISLADKRKWSLTSASRISGKAKAVSTDADLKVRVADSGKTRVQGATVSEHVVTKIAVECKECSKAA